MRALPDRLPGLAYVAVALSVACSVFPDEAILPAQGGGPIVDAGARASDGGAGLATGGKAGEPGVQPLGGSSSGGSGASGGGTGGHAAGGEAGGQAGGQAGNAGNSSQTCSEPQLYSDSTTFDLWIGSADDDANHGKEALLYVSGGADERRTLFAVTVPAAPAGVTLIDAEIVLTLESNADTSRAARQLGLYLLQTPLQDVVEEAATWIQYGKNKNKSQWDAKGGDLGERIALTELSAGTSSGFVRFDVTAAVRAALGGSPQIYGIFMREDGAAPFAPAQLAFTSREGNASVSAPPTLRLRYCQP